jgi:RHS repeat-associated protein
MTNRTRMLNMDFQFTCAACRDHDCRSRLLLRTVLCASTVIAVGFLSLTAAAQAPPPVQLRTPFGFQGARYDEETGLYYFRNRYNDPRTGRFLQRDPKHDPANLGNLYTFVGNSPSSRHDPFDTTLPIPPADGTGVPRGAWIGGRFVCDQPGASQPPWEIFHIILHPLVPSIQPDRALPGPDRPLTPDPDFEPPVD